MNNDNIHLLLIANNEEKRHIKKSINIFIVIFIFNMLLLGMKVIYCNIDRWFIVRIIISILVLVELICVRIYLKECLVFILLNCNVIISFCDIVSRCDSMVHFVAIIFIDISSVIYSADLLKKIRTYNQTIDDLVRIFSRINNIPDFVRISITNI